MNGFKVKFLLVLTASFGLFGQIIGQEPASETKKINFGYSKNPASRVKKNSDDSENTNQNLENVQISTNISSEPVDDSENLSAARKTFDVVSRANLANLAPTEIYRVGVSDVLFISLQNAPAKSSTYFTVLNDGSIDYPLGGGMVSVSGLTVAEIEELLRSKISLYENPQVAVKVREYASHPITVLGLVEKSGEKFIQREAVPLFVVKAEAIVQSDATEAFIRRADSRTETVDITEAKADEVLIFPGDIIEFKNSALNRKAGSASQFYYIGGNIVSGGQKDLLDGLTLTQAILASGGLKKNSAKNVIIRRKNESGLLSATSYNLREIKNGKIPDPVLQAGDTVEIDD